ncbi:MAG: hypothetical protein COW24_01710 [Candidatus Kerfeldbacteria bacterium CG15_BIG_FIL_POST_REV_8_21_14_020_45_12]|uniref:Uncharacterized protein n=1 Tax=Candidatus Kerfeldbacteria bacterium CG15_BIG_FIL_POST_REV_8_21_14_020_45_12 TaxID=2014247 RepID=A0A2M7H4K4_9BACT|nr:MAG: hypothetical protein COW24_01710 [Candidatus Kerfeldbacteria bacterium CG15_BIG_FIL_POST_REV_8_21_14_020_45_12]PJA92917.1 MAG: hypothetical protein CO132_05405 [Candidatus Kerfeldbacteria bacterium CG_4_9_14_3_um_filter_45_8]
MVLKRIESASEAVVGTYRFVEEYVLGVAESVILRQMLAGLNRDHPFELQIFEEALAEKLRESNAKQVSVLSIRQLLQAASLFAIISPKILSVIRECSFITEAALQSLQRRLDLSADTTIINYLLAHNIERVDLVPGGSFEIIYGGSMLEIPDLPARSAI